MIKSIRSSAGSNVVLSNSAVVRDCSTQTLKIAVNGRSVDTLVLQFSADHSGACWIDSQTRQSSPMPLQIGKRNHRLAASFPWVETMHGVPPSLKFNTNTVHRGLHDSGLANVPWGTRFRFFINNLRSLRVVGIDDR